MGLAALKPILLLSSTIAADLPVTRGTFAR